MVKTAQHFQNRTWILVYQFFIETYIHSGNLRCNCDTINVKTGEIIEYSINYSTCDIKRA